jgi:hypothetical protein
VSRSRPSILADSAAWGSALPPRLLQRCALLIDLCSRRSCSRICPRCATPVVVETESSSVRTCRSAHIAMIESTPQKSVGVCLSEVDVEALRGVPRSHGPSVVRRLKQIDGSRSRRSVPSPSAPGAGSARPAPGGQTLLNPPDPSGKINPAQLIASNSGLQRRGLDLLESFGLIHVATLGIAPGLNDNPNLVLDRELGALASRYRFARALFGDFVLATRGDSCHADRLFWPPRLSSFRSSSSKMSLCPTVEKSSHGGDRRSYS